MKVFLARCIQCVALVLMFILCFGGVFSGPNYVLVGIGIAIGIAGIVVWLIFGKCPHCGEYLRRNTPEYCPYCGKKIE